MPKLNMDSIVWTNISQEEVTIINMVIKKDGSLKASKPKAKKHDDPNTVGKAQYVWRMAAFMVSPKPQHHCMPVCACFDLPAYNEDGKWKSDIARTMEKSLDKVINIIVDAVKMSDWHGVHRWSKALYGR
jgi:hypothetical protein